MSVAIFLSVSCIGTYLFSGSAYEVFTQPRIASPQRPGPGPRRNPYRRSHHAPAWQADQRARFEPRGVTAICAGGPTARYVFTAWRSTRVSFFVLGVDPARAVEPQRCIGKRPQRTGPALFGRRTTVLGFAPAFGSQSASRCVSLPATKSECSFVAPLRSRGTSPRVEEKQSCGRWFRASAPRAARRPGGLSARGQNDSSKYRSVPWMG